MRKTIMVVCVMILTIAVSAAFAQDTTHTTQSEEPSTIMRIKLVSVMVNDQAKAEKFYTEILGFVKKQDIPLGEFKWLTVVSPDEPDGPELLLEPNQNPDAQVFQKAMYKQGLPIVVFTVDDVQKTFEKLKKAGVVFKSEPTEYESTIYAVFDDTCGNFIQIIQG